MFSASSFGFRQGAAHDALVVVRQYVAEGRTIVVDLDLEEFFDQVMASISQYLEGTLGLGRR
jgi:RNA-directed DNA polymerase